MPLARLCADCGTPTIGTRCTACAGRHGAPRAARKAKRYDAAYDQARRTWAAHLEHGDVPCSRCQTPVNPAAWDLDHHPDLGLWPAHPKCNRAAH